MFRRYKDVSVNNLLTSNLTLIVTHIEKIRFVTLLDNVVIVILLIRI